MSSISRIFVIEDDEHIGQQLVNALRNDGYGVWGVTNGGDAVRALWADEYDVVIYDLDAPGIEGFELLQWLRAYHPNTRTVLLGGIKAEKMRTQALENGAVSYLEKPLDVRLLREELRRMQDDTGFTVDLDSFDLLDVIQIITMSRKNIALLVNTGLEERGLLRFQNGELVWAEYGFLRGEEAFFALAAHKNGTVIHQPWNGQVIPNVKQPLSRLIMQALQYRTKYGQGEMPQPTGAQPALNALSFDDIDDTPFGMVATTEGASGQIPVQPSGAFPATNGMYDLSSQVPVMGGMPQPSGQLPAPNIAGAMPGQFSVSETSGSISDIWPTPGSPSGSMPVAGNMPFMPETDQDFGISTSLGQMNQTPASGIHSALSQGLNAGSGSFPAQPLGQPVPESGLRDVIFGPAIIQQDEGGVGMSDEAQKEWWERTGELPRLDEAMMREWSKGQVVNTNGLQPAAQAEAGNDGQAQLFAPQPSMQAPQDILAQQPLPSWLTDQPTASNLPVIRPGMTEPGQASSPAQGGEWSDPYQAGGSGPVYGSSGLYPLQQGSGMQPAIRPESVNEVGGETMRRPAITNNHLQSFQARNTSGPLPINNSVSGVESAQANQSQNRDAFNYPALSTALQTLGYSVKGFVAAAVVSIEGSPLAQISVDDSDVTPLCAPLSAMMKSAQQGAELGGWGACEDVLLRNAGRYIMARIVGSRRSTFLVVITTHEANPAESLSIVANIESAVNAAL
ncbi:hypothetical protein KSD_14320 [Ktedonobacter sp. SOSP1-85]|uniref:response regulator n=1 Tax=Ktedonobacter sp. SOSP1-85 TaxID=2778367 RepID=UPI0019156F6D|nr:response regulator [Ktedonobacter sp. SOSP1-85]GHO73661.1 hypothetical protein KSD_14320 [Ktedonobacter sp. SOSP1-85]